MLSGQAWADDFTIGNLKYTITDAEKHEVSVGKISDNNKPEGDLVIPAEVEYEGEKYAVTSIGEGAFKYCGNLTSVTLPNSVTSISEWAFYDCSKFTEINVENTNTNFTSENGVLFNKDKTAIVYCPTGKTGTYTIPETVTHIAQYAFFNCDGLTSVTIPNTITQIEKYAFFSCSGLTLVTIPNSVTSIGENAFDGCSSLIAVTIPESVTSIGEDAFDHCSKLTEINVENTNTNYTSENGVLFDKAKTTLICCPDGKTGTYIIPNSVTSIGDKAFDFCSNLTSVTIPNSVTRIGHFAFYGCSGLTSVTILNSFPSIGADAFDGFSSLAYNEYDNSYYLGNDENPYLWLIKAKSTDITSCEINENCKYIYNDAFSSCSSLKSVTIPNSVTNIGEHPFYGCSSMQSITLPYVFEHHIGYMFDGCDIDIWVDEPVDGNPNVITTRSYSIPSTLKSITVNGGKIPYEAFCKCNNLTSLTITESVTSIDEFAFYGCTIDTLTYNTKAFSRLSGGIVQTVIIGDSITEIAEWAFYGKDCLTSIIIPNSVTKIGNDAFADCENLTYNVYDNANYLGNDDNPYLVLVAAKDKDIKSCDINFRCRIIYDDAFYGCKQLSAILIPDLVLNFSGYAFARCDNLTSINVESGNTNYSSENGDVYSKDKKNLVCVPAGKTGDYTVSNSVDSICGYSFSRSNLTSITIPFGVKSIASYAFYYCEKLNVLTIPMGVEFIDENTIWECKNLTIYCEETSRPKGWSEYWNDYHKIVWGYKPTLVTESAANAVNIYAYGNTIVVENATDEISVYDAMGRLVGRDAINRVRTEIRINTAGLYIVKVGNVAKRVMVNN